LRRQRRSRAQPFGEDRRGDRLAVPVHLAGTVDGDLHVVGLGQVGRGTGLGQVHLDRMGQQGRGDDEDHQQHQHDVDQRDHVDFGQCFVAVVVVEGGESHGGIPQALARAEVLATTRAMMRSDVAATSAT
jgi:hypothetical protein